jgi:DNA replication protein
MTGDVKKSPTGKAKFAGFPPGKTEWTTIPTTFFSDLLPLVADVAELKVVLFFFWALPQLEGKFRYLRRHNFVSDVALMQGLAVTNPDVDPEATLDGALALAVEQAILLRADIPLKAKTETLYFLNTERGRTAIEQIKLGQWRPGDSDNPIEILPEQPNIYKHYEANIGALTPMIADELKDMEKEFSATWIEEAMRLAVQKEARHLRFIRAVLERWRKEGKKDAATRRQDEEDPERYVRGKYADFIEH